MEKTNNKNLLQCLIMAALVAIFFVLSCKNNNNTISKKKDKYLRDYTLSQKIENFNNNVFPVMQKSASTGDLITRMGTDITSLLLSKINFTDTSYSHCGIVSIENDSAFVYHCIGGELNPDQKMKREWLYEFAHPENSKRLGLFSPLLTQQQKGELLQHVKYLYESGLLFDTAFDLSTDNRQYCSEMVAKSLGKVLGDLNWVEINSSDNLKWISIESLYLNNLMKEKIRMNY